MLVRKLRNKVVLINGIKLILTFLIIVLFFVYVLNHTSLSTISPDSIRFMHFWQINIDHFNSDGGTAKSALKAIYHALDSSNKYDVNRGRLLQPVMYGIDVLTRWLFLPSWINIWMIFLVSLNSALIAWIATSPLRNQEARLNVFCLGWLVLVTTSVVISPVMLLILYGKYLWITFVMAFFITKRVTAKIIWLAAAAFSDEIGLFAVMLLTFLIVLRHVLNNVNVDSISFRDQFVKPCILSVIASLTVLFVFYGILAVLFNSGATGALGFGITVGQKTLQYTLWNIIHGVLWCAEILVIGFPLGYGMITIIVGLVVIIIVSAGILKNGKTIMISRSGTSHRLVFLIREWLYEERGLFYTFWIIMFLLNVIIILTRDRERLTHYSYPAAAVIGILLISTLVDLLSVRLVIITLVAVLAVHLIMLPRAVAFADNSLTNYLFPDGTVSSEDINIIKKCVVDMRRNGSSSDFNYFNNGQEIDFSGTWFYSRIKAHSVSGPYFPVQGMVRVLLWPEKIKSITPNRIFDYKTPTFKDLKGAT